MEFRTKPFAHQIAELDAHGRDPSRAIFWEQGTGKTKLILDTFALLADEVSGLLILAPNGVHLNWTESQIPLHLSPMFEADCGILAYRTSRQGTRAQKRDIAQLSETRWAILAMSYDAFVTKHGKAVGKAFLEARRCLYVLDESTRIKTPSALRTKVVLASAAYAPYRRILTGTPVADGPFDVYAPMRFLDPLFWRGKGFAAFGAFRAHFGVYRRGFNGTSGREFDQLVAYRNLEQLSSILTPMSSRVTKDEVLDLPPKLYSKHVFDLDPAARKIYDDLRDDFRTWLEGGDLVTVPGAMERLLRLQQVTCGYLPVAESDRVEILLKNARLEAFSEIATDLSHSTLVWCRFRRDVENVLGCLKKLGKSAVRYDGTVKDLDRVEAVRAFQAGNEQFFVGTLDTASEGLTLHRAQTSLYYSNSFKLSHRLQSEARPHRSGLLHPVHYIDLVARDTVDEHLIKTLRKKNAVAHLVTGDTLKEWIT